MTLTRGWRLLRGFGLDQRERNNVLAACRNSLRFEDVVPSLRQQWLDDDIQNRDANRKGKSGKGSGKHGGKNKGGQVANYVGGEMMVVEQDGGWSYDASGCPTLPRRRGKPTRAGRRIGPAAAVGMKAKSH